MKRWLAKHWSSVTLDFGEGQQSPFERKTLTTACIDSQSCWEIATSFLLRKLLAFIFLRKRNPICRDTAELWEQGRWERAQAQGALFIAFSLVPLRRSYEEEAFGSVGVVWLIFLLGPYLILLSGRSVQKNNKENTARRLQDCHVAVTMVV